jgi:hypothetical protein
MTQSTATPELSWPGAFNLADVGGLQFAAGGVTRPGRVFRSARPDHLTTEGWRRARAAGVSTVIDLRSPGESDREAGGPLADPAVLEGISMLSRPTEEPDDPEFVAACGPWLDHPRSYADNIRLYPAKFAAVFRSIARAEGGVLVHCAAGRDRTGMVIAMLLGLAGVTPEAIADDYVAAATRFNAGLGVQPGLTEETPHSPQEMAARLSVRRAALIDWIAHLDVAAYLADAGVTDPELERLRTRLR